MSHTQNLSQIVGYLEGAYREANNTLIQLDTISQPALNFSGEHQLGQSYLELYFNMARIAGIVESSPIAELKHRYNAYRAALPPLPTPPKLLRSRQDECY